MSSRHDNGGLIAVGKGVHVVQDGVGFSVDGSHMTEREPVWIGQAKEDGLYRRAMAITMQVPPKGAEWCPDCVAWRDRGMFAQDLTRRTGLDAYCKEHRAERNRERYRRDVEAQGRLVRSYRRETA